MKEGGTEIPAVRRGLRPPATPPKAPVGALVILGGLFAGVAVIQTWRDIALVTVSALVVVALSKLSLRAFLFRLRPFAYFAAITLLFGGLGPGETVLAWGPFHWGLQTIDRAAVAAARLILLGASATWMSLDAGMGRLIALLTAFGRFTQRFGVDLTPVLVSFSVAIRFLPLVQEESRRLRLAWEARGAALYGRGPVARARYASGLVVPLLAAALRRAESLAEAIESRTPGRGDGTWRGLTSSFSSEADRNLLERSAGPVRSDEAGGNRLGQGFKGAGAAVARRVVQGVAAWLPLISKVWTWVG